MLWLAVLPGAFVAALLTTVFLVHSIDSIEQGLRTRGIAISRQVAALAEFGLFAGQRVALGALTASALGLDPDVTGAAIVAADGELLAQSGALHNEHWRSLAPTGGRTLEGEVLLFIEPVVLRRLAVDDIYGGVPSSVKDPKPIGHVVLELSRREASARISRLVSIAFLIATLGAALGGWLAWRIALAVTRPLISATEVVERIGHGDLEARMVPGDAGPLHSLALGINHMAARIRLNQDDLRRRIAEATLGIQREKDAAERATLAKSHFLAAASHDLRQPLHALGLFVAALSQSDAADQEPELVAHIRSATDTLQNLLDAILDISRLDSGTVEPRVRPFALGPLLERIQRSLGLVAEHKGLRFRLRSTQAWVNSDEEMIQRILLNLVSNALRYTHRGGVLLAARVRPDAVRIEIWDTGSGIPEASRQEIFDEYVQLENPERDRAKGLGLGLAICRRLTDMLKVPLGVRSQPGRGSVFWISLPRVPAEAEPVAASFDAGDELARLDGTVLVVDRDPLVRAGMETAISGWGARVVLAGNAEQALVRCVEGGTMPDMVICNLNLPGRQNGIDLVQELRGLFPRIGILLVSADVSEATQAAARAAGFQLLKQPLPPGRLRAALRNMLPPKV